MPDSDSKNRNEHLVLRVNALYVVQGEGAYETFITEQNEQIERYKKEVFPARKSKKTTTSETK